MTTLTDIPVPRAADLKRGLTDALPVAAAVIAYGSMLGAQATQHGFRIVEVPLMTGSNYAGGSEFAAIGLWASPPPLLLIASVTVLINSRHLVMGAALAPHLRHLPRWQALLVLFLMSDETWALSYSDTLKRAAAEMRPAFSVAYYAGVGGAIYVSWVGSTTLGAAIGPLLGDVATYGFDMAFPAVFLAMLAGLWNRGRGALAWGVSLAIAALTHLAVPGAWYVIVGTLAGLGTVACRSRPG